MGIVDLILKASSVITALGIILVFIPKGRDWLVKPAMDLAKENLKTITRQEILLLLSTHPEQTEAIENTYDAYVRMGGNSYISQVIKRWRGIG